MTIDECRNAGDLRDLVRLIGERGAVTAAQVAVDMGCCRVVAHDRLKRLVECGVAVRTSERTRESARGPTSWLYALAEGRS